MLRRGVGIASEVTAGARLIIPRWFQASCEPNQTFDAEAACPKMVATRARTRGTRGTRGWGLGLWSEASAGSQQEKAHRTKGIQIPGGVRICVVTGCTASVA